MLGIALLTQVPALLSSSWISCLVLPSSSQFMYESPEYSFYSLLRIVFYLPYLLNFIYKIIFKKITFISRSSKTKEKIFKNHKVIHKQWSFKHFVIFGLSLILGKSATSDEVMSIRYPNSLISLPSSSPRGSYLMDLVCIF